MGEHKRKKRIFSNKISKSKVATFIILITIVVIAVYDFTQSSNKSPLDHIDLSRSKGDPQAPLKIVEIVDFQCSNCAVGSKILKSYMEKYPQGIYLSIKYYPLGELNSTISAIYAQCAARQNRFWDYHDRLFSQQSQWRRERVIRPILSQMAEDLNLDMQEYHTCVGDKKVAALVSEERMQGESLFVKATPTYFINGEMIIGPDALKKTLEEFFEKKTDEFL